MHAAELAAELATRRGWLGYKGQTAGGGAVYLNEVGSFVHNTHIHLMCTSKGRKPSLPRGESREARVRKLLSD